MNHLPLSCELSAFPLSPYLFLASKLPWERQCARHTVALHSRTLPTIAPWLQGLCSYLPRHAALLLEAFVCYYLIPPSWAGYPESCRYPPTSSFATLAIHSPKYI